MLLGDFLPAEGIIPPAAYFFVLTAPPALRCFSPNILSSRPGRGVNGGRGIPGRGFGRGFGICPLFALDGRGFGRGILFCPVLYRLSSRPALRIAADIEERGFGRGIGLDLEERFVRGFGRGIGLDLEERFGPELTITPLLF
jgi:hypothetical protein